MDAHPVPQNVTSFEFHLIGDMTLKQFTYLASGLVTGYLVFFTLYPISSILAIPIISLAVGAGVAFAFLPIADRPLDHWFVAFFKAVYAPTKRLWRSNFGTLTVGPANPQFHNRLNLYLSTAFNTLPPTIETTIPQLNPPTATPKSKGLTRILSATQEDSQPQTVKRGQQAGQSSTIDSQLLQQNQLLRQQLSSLKQQLQQNQLPPSALIHPPLSLPTSAPIQTIPTSPPLHLQPSPVPLSPSIEPFKQMPLRKISLSNSPMVAGPNIIAGTVVDLTGKIIDGAIIIITDQGGIPVRALKTTKLGQFTGVTPLPNGIYSVSAEKEGLTFSPVQVELKGELIKPLVIQAN